MKFCRSCGTGLANVQAAQNVHNAVTPNAFANMPPPGPLASLTPVIMPNMPPPPPTLPPGNSAISTQLSPSAPTMMAPVPANVAAASNAPAMPSAIAGTPLAAVAPVPLPYGQEPPPTLLPGSPGAAAVASARQSGPAAVIPGPPPAAAPAASAPGMIACPRCSAATPIGFVYCQACGLHIQAVAPTDPGGPPARPRTASSQVPPLAAPPQQGQQAQQPPTSAPQAPMQQPQANIDPQAATIASDPRAVGTPQPRAASVPGGVQWGTAILVNRDGSDGDRHTLDAEYTVIGRAGADIAFDEDRFLARLHARLERGADGVVRVSPTDTLNGVFRKTDAPVELVDGLVILVGREVLRFEKVDAEERNVTPLIRHGVALFGSPPREPWGRLLQILPSGGHRDIRHLAGEEVVLGREEGDIVFRDDAFMSRRHAAITWDGARAQLTDLGSSNGTFVRLTGATQIKHGDHLRLGDQLLRIELGR